MGGGGGGGGTLPLGVGCSSVTGVGSTATDFVADLDLLILLSLFSSSFFLFASSFSLFAVSFFKRSSSCFFSFSATFLSFSTCLSSLISAVCAAAPVKGGDAGGGPDPDSGLV